VIALHAEGWRSMERAKTSQARPMAISCLLVIALVMSFVAAGVALFFTPSQGQPIQSKATPSLPTMR
jgi:hypothetical protein